MLSPRNRAPNGATVGTVGSGRAGEAAGMTGQGTSGRFWAPAGLLSEQSSKRGGRFPSDLCPVAARCRRAPALRVDTPTSGRQVCRGKESSSWKTSDGDLHGSCTKGTQHVPHSQDLWKPSGALAHSTSGRGWKSRLLANQAPCLAHCQRRFRTGSRTWSPPVPPLLLWPTHPPARVPEPVLTSLPFSLRGAEAPPRTVIRDRGPWLIRVR